MVIIKNFILLLFCYFLFSCTVTHHRKILFDVKSLQNQKSIIRTDGFYHCNKEGGIYNNIGTIKYVTILMFYENGFLYMLGVIMESVIIIVQVN